MEFISGRNLMYQDINRTYTIVERALDTIFTLFANSLFYNFNYNLNYKENKNELWKRINNRYA